MKILLTLLFAVCSCTITNIQNAHVRGPVQKSPVRITEDIETARNIIRFGVANSFSTKIRSNTGTHSEVNSDNMYELEAVENKNYFYERDNSNIYPYTGKNLQWETPHPHYNIEVEMQHARASYFAGINYSSSGTVNFFGGNAGFAISTPVSDLMSRFNINLLLYQRKYNVNYVTRKALLFDSNYDYKVWKQQNNEKKVNFDVEIDFTLNSRNQHWPLNYFIKIGFGTETLFDFKNADSESEDVSLIDYYSSVSLGIYKTIGDRQRLILGPGFNSHFIADRSYFIPDIIFQYELIF